MTKPKPLQPERVTPVLDRQNSQTADPSGTVLLQDRHLTGKPVQPTSERILEQGDVRHSEALLKTGALQSAIFNSANFSSIATDAKGCREPLAPGTVR